MFVWSNSRTLWQNGIDWTLRRNSNFGSDPWPASAGSGTRLEVLHVRKNKGLYLKFSPVQIPFSPLRPQKIWRIWKTWPKRLENCIGWRAVASRGTGHPIYVYHTGRTTFILETPTFLATLVGQRIDPHDDLQCQAIFRYDWHRMSYGVRTLGLYNTICMLLKHISRGPNVMSIHKVIFRYFKCNWYYTLGNLYKLFVLYRNSH